MSSLTKEATTSGRIPKAPFIENVDEFLKARNVSAEALIKELDELYGKYRFMEINLLARKRNLLSKLPDIESSLEAVHYLASRQQEAPVLTRFEVSDLLYTQAMITKRDKVHLWLGANVMLEYELDEATSLLEKNLNNAKTLLKQVNEDLDAVKDSITILEVGMARVYNYDVRLRRMERETK
jgi:prefoldin subunit 5